MKSINEPISYKWPWGWDSEIGQDYPVVNRLLKAVIEKDISEMDRLWKQGASLKETDSVTLRCVLFQVIKEYPVMKWLIGHGVSRITNDFPNDECISPYGYIWGLSGRAYYCQAYNVMELLCAHGFKKFYCYEPHWDVKFDADEHIFDTENETGVRVLLEHGYGFSHTIAPPGSYGAKEYRYYEKYVLNRPQVKRKTVGLSRCLWSGTNWWEAEFDKYEKVPILFGRKEAIRRNERRLQDYEDQKRAHKEFVKRLGVETYEKYRKMHK